MKLRCPDTRCHGFTLLELMVVLVLVGIIISMMTLSVGDGGKYRDLQDEAERLKTLINMAREEVIMRSQDWSIAFQENGYRFERQVEEEVDGVTKKKWVPIENQIYRPRKLSGYRLSIEIEDDDYTRPAGQKKEDEEDTIGRVFIYASGEMMKFELTIAQEQGDDSFTLKASPLGELSLISSRDKQL